MKAAWNKSIALNQQWEARLDAACGHSVRVMFPLLLRKDGKPRKQQRPVWVSLNGDGLAIPRGRPVIVPSWVIDVCSLEVGPYECFVSTRKASP